MSDTFVDYWNKVNGELENETGEALAEIVFNEAYQLGLDESLAPYRDFSIEDQDKIKKLQKKLELTEKKVKILEQEHSFFQDMLELKKLDEQIKGLDSKGEK